MTHEHARLIVTVASIIVPIVLTGLMLALIAGSENQAALGVLLFIIAVLLGIFGHLALYVLTAFWNCGECGEQYFAYFMPYWPIDKRCQNCGELD